jgi:hypothetical protein
MFMGITNKCESSSEWHSWVFLRTHVTITQIHRFTAFGVFPFKIFKSKAKKVPSFSKLHTLQQPKRLYTMKLQNTFFQALALAGVSHATRIYVSSYSGNITTVDLSPKNGGLEGNLTLTPVAQSTGCFPSPSWLEFDKKTSTLYCSDEGNPDPTKASFSSFQTSANGTLYMLDRITTLNGCVYSKIYENDTALAIAN